MLQALMLCRCEDTALDYGINALSCILEGARVDNEEKTRKYLARFFWLFKVVFTIIPVSIFSIFLLGDF